jgi:LPS sulfotransferase NodH
LVRTSENGVFAIKAHYGHLAKLHAVDEEPYRYKLISVTRRDKLKQAVSFARAQQTRSWIADMPDLADPCYDWRLIYEKLMRIVGDEAKWEAYFLLLRVEPLRVYYEDFVSDAQAAIEKVYAYVGVQRSRHEGALSGGFVPSRQADGLAADWVSRFLEEAPSRLHDVLVQEVETEKKRHNGGREGGRFAKLLGAMRIRR